MNTRKAPAHKLNLEPPKTSVQHRWWMGALTLAFFSVVGIGLAVAVEAGMTFQYENSPKAINAIFNFLGFPGLFAKMAIANTVKIPSQQLRQIADLSCTAVNAIVYTALLLMWFLRDGDDKLKKDHRAAKLSSRSRE